MTTPSYTTRVSGDTGALPRTGIDAGESSLAPGWRGWLGTTADRLSRHPRLVQAGLDVAAIGFIVLAFSQSSVSAEFLFHCVFVLLVLHAFLFGLRGTLLRIGLASIPLVLYAEAAVFGLDEPPLELTEWPLMFVIAALVAWMADRRTSTSRRYATLFRNASERLLTVEEDERRRIAGELHDGVGQVLTALTLTLDAAAGERNAAVARKRIGTARAMADTALAGTRELSHRMRPARIEERGLVTALRDLAAQSGFPVAVEADPQARDPQLLSATATVELYRIVQEALANAARHSGAEHATVDVRVIGGRLSVTVADDGEGFDPADVSETGIGLAGMQERARLIGAQLSISSTEGAGTTVTLSLPTEAR